MFGGVEMKPSGKHCSTSNKFRPCSLSDERFLLCTILLPDVKQKFVTRRQTAGNHHVNRENNTDSALTKVFTSNGIKLGMMSFTKEKKTKNIPKLDYKMDHPGF